MKAGLFTLFFVLPLFAHAQTVLKLSTVYPPGSEAVSSLQQVSKTLEAMTNGEVRLKVYPGGVMGDDSTVMRKIRIGQLHGALFSSSTVEVIAPEINQLSYAFQFDSLDQVYKLRETEDKNIHRRLNDEHWIGFGPLDGGFSYLMSNKPVSSMTELRRTKMWLPNTPSIQALSKELKVDYLVMGIGDVLTALDTGAINALISPPAAALTLNWHSRFDYFTNTPVIYTWAMLVLPERALKKIPVQHREVTQQALTAWAAELELRLRDGNSNALRAIEQLLQATSFSHADIQLVRSTQEN